MTAESINEGNIMDESQIDERLHAVEVAQAVGEATLAGAQATQAAAQAGTVETTAAMQAGNVAITAAGSLGLIAGIFLGLSIRAASK